MERTRAQDEQFQSTSPVWRTTRHYGVRRRKRGISIHVPRVEDDSLRCWDNRQRRNFNPRPPCGGRLIRDKNLSATAGFQSTSPVWRTTSWRVSAFLIFSYFNPRPPCGGRPREDADEWTEKIFQSTSPVWRTTPTERVWIQWLGISIHVPRVEDDV